MAADIDPLIAECMALGTANGGDLPSDLRPHRLLTPEDAADYLGMQPVALWYRRRYRSGPSYYQIGARAVRYRVPDLESYREASGSRTFAGPKLGRLDPGRLLTHDEAAEFIGMSAAALWILSRDSSGPARVRIGPRTMRYTVQDIEVWLARRRVEVHDSSQGDA